MDIETWIERKNKITRRRFLELHSDIVNSLPEDRVTFYLNDLRETSARRIQAAWRGYQVRQKFAEMKDDMKREKAAVIMQRRVRHWLNDKHEKRNCIESSHLKRRIGEDRLHHLQQQVNRWQENIKFPGEKNVVDFHSQVQNKLASFLWHRHKANSRQQCTNSKCVQLEALSLLMNELPILSQCEDVDLNWYHCSSLPLAASARLAHKQQLRSLTAPWWQKLKL